MKFLIFQLVLGRNDKSINALSILQDSQPGHTALIPLSESVRIYYRLNFLYFLGKRTFITVSNVQELSGDNVLEFLYFQMYVKAELSDPSRAVVEIGTGYFAEMNRDKAQAFLERKKAYITKQVFRLLTLKRNEKFESDITEWSPWNSEHFNIKFIILP